MNITNFILFAIMITGMWVQTQGKKQTGKTTKISCASNDNCLAFVGEGATCKNDFCVCENEEPCESHRTDARARSNIIGEDCAEDYNCNIQYSYCSEGYCSCKSDRVTANDARRCLEVSDGLGAKCEEDVQCIRKIPGSVCKDFKCVCDEFHQQNESDCFFKVGLGQECKQQSQCSHITRAHCGAVFCQCDAGFVESNDRTKCLPVATKPLDPCEETVQCRQLYYHGAKCIYGRCECDDVHRLANTTGCPSRLTQKCANDNECKAYPDDPTMHCVKDRCECLHPFIAQDGVCNGSMRKTFALISAILTVLFILIPTQL